MFNNYLKSEKHLLSARKGLEIGRITQQKQKNKRIEEYNKNPNKCKNCEEIFPYEKRHSIFCNCSCSASYNNKKRTLSIITRQKISKTLKARPNERSKHNEIIKKICPNCNNEFETTFYSRKKMFCSRSCASSFYNKNHRDILIKAGLKSAKVQQETRRSKNEIYFAELCKQFFNNVKTNESIFNGWDADVILENEKIAILWNGKWHYEKLNKKHSVKQVQNRDEIKIKEINKMGYQPYIIKDMGKYNKEFVEKQFEIFKQYIAGCEK